MKQIYQNTFFCLKLIINLSLVFFVLGCQKDKQPSEEVLHNKPLSVHIEVEEEIPIDNEIPCKVVFIENEDSLLITGKIERRGGFSIIYNKHSYKINLKGDFSIGGLQPDDDWILNANYIDKSFMRHTLSYELFKKMNPINNIASNWKYIEVYLNQQYAGLYVLMERLDRSTLKIEKPDTAAFIFKEPPIFREDLATFVPQDIENYNQQTYPNIEDFDKTGYLNAVRDFLVNANDTLFSQKVATVFDISNIIDWHLLLLYSNNGDGILKNFYLYKKSKNNLLQIAPWDYDHSFGRFSNNGLNIVMPIKPQRAILLNRLLQCNWYTKQLKKRWIALNDKQILGVKPVSDIIDNYADELSLLVEKNFALWPIEGWPYQDNNNFSDEIEVMKQYLNVRQNQLDIYFNQL